MKVRDALADAARRLSGSSESPRLDAELILAHALGVSRDALLLEHCETETPATFGPLVARRLAHEPVAYIIGRRAFWTIELDVGPGALVPRPDSETLLEAAVEHFGRCAPATILDLGTGPGTLLLAALSQWPQARGLGIDSAEAALELARRNVRDLGLEERASFRIGNWAAGVADRFDLVLCNPPYIAQGADLPPDVARFEPATALFAGPDGLDAYRALASQLPPLVAPGGVACIELGAGQEQAVRTLFAGARLTMSAHRDLAGISRCLILRT